MVIDARHRFIGDAATPPRFARIRKRAFDLTVASIMAIALTPVMLAIALGSAAGDRAWTVFISHHRPGHKGEVLQLWLMVTGRLSRIGPRPETPDLDRRRRCWR